VILKTTEVVNSISMT